MGVTGLETAFSVLYTELVLPGVIDLGLLVERMGAGRRALRARAGARSRADAEAEHRARRPRRRVGGGRRRLGEPLGQLLLRRPALRSRVLLTIVGGQVAYRRRAFAMRVA